MLQCRDSHAQLAAVDALSMLITHCPAASQGLPHSGSARAIVHLLSHQDSDICAAAAALMAALARDDANQTALGAAAPFAPLASLVARDARGVSTHAADALHHLTQAHAENKGRALRGGAASALVALCQSQVWGVYEGT